MLENYISRRGYTINKRNLNTKEIHKIKTELFVQPFDNQKFLMEKFGNLPPKFKVYLENEKKLYLPRYYGIQNFGEAKSNIINKGDEINLSFTGTLRKEQELIMNEFLPKFLKDKGGILNLKTGIGKTALALYMISKIKKKTLVVVHKEFLMNQWKERIHKFLPNAKIGIIQSNKLIIDDCDIVIGMLQSISLKDYDPKIFSSFGLNILDEIHNFGSQCYSRAFPKICAELNLGLSATIQRKDNMQRILYWNIGPVYCPPKSQNSDFGKVKCLKVLLSDPDFQVTYYNYNGNVNYPKMINKLVESNKRIDLIIKLVTELCLKKRKILILSERRKQLLQLKKKLDELNISCGLCVGGIKQSELDKSIKTDVLLATYSYVQEAFDVEELNTLILATPKSDVVQAIGRIMRQSPEERKFIPLIIDIVDDTDRMKKKYNLRKKYYKKSNFDIIEHEKKCSIK